MKKSFYVIIFFLFLFAISVYALEVPKLKGYINDNADMISPAVEERLSEELKSFEQTDSTQIVILTVSSLEREAIEDFSIRVADSWKIGQAIKDNGIILLVAKEDRKIRIEVGRGLEGRLTDLMAGRIIDLVMKPLFKRGDFDGGFIAGISALIDSTRGEFKGEERPVSQGQRGLSPFFTFLIFWAIFIIVLGTVSRILGGISGAIGLPALVHLMITPLGLIPWIALAVFGLGAGILIPLFFSPRRYRGYRGGGIILPGGGIFGRGGGFGGDFGGGGGFSGGGGGFGGGGASGNW